MIISINTQYEYSFLFLLPFFCYSRVVGPVAHPTKLFFVFLLCLSPLPFDSSDTSPSRQNLQAGYLLVHFFQNDKDSTVKIYIYIHLFPLFYELSLFIHPHFVSSLPDKCFLSRPTAFWRQENWEIHLFARLRSNYTNLLSFHFALGCFPYSFPFSFFPPHL
jgi:hypothetical protein